MSEYELGTERFMVSKSGKDVVDVLLLGARYRYEARHGYSKIEASTGDELQESSR